MNYYVDDRKTNLGPKVFLEETNQKYSGQWR